MLVVGLVLVVLAVLVILVVLVRTRTHLKHQKEEYKGRGRGPSLLLVVLVVVITMGVVAVVLLVVELIVLDHVPQSVAIVDSDDEHLLAAVAVAVRGRRLIQDQEVEMVDKEGAIVAIVALEVVV